MPARRLAEVNKDDPAERLCENHSLDLSEYEELLARRGQESAERLKTEADRLKTEIYGRDVYVRGLIEISNICRNDCLYCGLRRSNKKCDRYRLSEEEILSCADKGYELGFRTFVLQGGEDGFFDDRVLGGIIKEIKRRHGDCAVTLSMGERSRESYERLFDAGADRYLLRHETAEPSHYGRLHPDEMSYENRMECLKVLKEIGYQTGCMLNESEMKYRISKAGEAAVPMVNYGMAIACMNGILERCIKVFDRPDERSLDRSAGGSD